MLYRIRATGEYLVTEWELRSRFPNVSLPATIDAAALDSLGVDPVQAAPVPALTDLEEAYELPPVLVDGAWVQAWGIKNRFNTPEEEAAYLDAQRVRVILPLDFRRRIVPATMLNITLSASQALEAGDGTLQVFLDDLSASRQVELDNPVTAEGVAFLATSGLITEAEATALLADANPTEAAAIRAAGIL